MPQIPERIRDIECTCRHWLSSAAVAVSPAQVLPPLHWPSHFCPTMQSEEEQDDMVAPVAAVAVAAEEERPVVPAIVPPDHPERESAAAPAAHGVASAKRKTKGRAKPSIDLDDHIRKAQEAIKSARRQVQAARVRAKNEKRKKQRLMKKASNLNVEDLERIAVLKRCGLVMAEANASTGSTSAGDHQTASAAASSSGSPASASA